MISISSHFPQDNLGGNTKSEENFNLKGLPCNVVCQFRQIWPKYHYDILMSILKAEVEFLAPGGVGISSSGISHSMGRRPSNSSCVIPTMVAPPRTTVSLFQQTNRLRDFVIRDHTCHTQKSFQKKIWKTLWLCFSRIRNVFGVQLEPGPVQLVPILLMRLILWVPLYFLNLPICLQHLKNLNKTPTWTYLIPSYFGCPSLSVCPYYY